MSWTNRATVTSVLIFVFVVAFDGPRLSAQEATTGASENAKIINRLQSLKDLPAGTKEKLSKDLQAESKLHYGFTAIKSLDDALAIDVSSLTAQQRSLLGQTTQHVVNGNLVPIVVLKDSLKYLAPQPYPDLNILIASHEGQLAGMYQSVGRIGYTLKRQLSTGALPEGTSSPAGTGFVIAPGLVATACHVLDYFTDTNSGIMSPDVSVEINFSDDSNLESSFAVTGVAGKGSLQGEDYAILKVQLVNGHGALPKPLEVGPDTNTNYLAVVGYPDLDEAKRLCVSGGTKCDESIKYFADYKIKMPEAKKLMSTGHKTGDFQPLGFPILTYDASTLSGQSGSPVIDLQSMKVVGIHYCCTGNKPRESEPLCARLKPLSLAEKGDNEGLVIDKLNLPK